MSVPAELQHDVSASRDPLTLMRLIARFNLHPEVDLHPSWLPADWPVRHRHPVRWNDGGRAMLSRLLLQQQLAGTPPLFNFDERLARLALVDGASLRRLAFYTGLCAHLPLLKLRSPLGLALRRQALRFDAEAVEFALDRVPSPTTLKMDDAPMQHRPHAAGRIVAARGYRLLLAAAASAGITPLKRVQLKLPRRVSALSVPHLRERQLHQLDELMLSCIVPERLPQWDWLF
jgi:type III secretion protein K